MFQSIVHSARTLPLTVLILILVLSVIKVASIINLFNTALYIYPLLILSCHPICKKTRLTTDPEEDSPGPDSYTLMEDGHVSINDNYGRAANENKGTYTTI